MSFERAVFVPLARLASGLHPYRWHFVVVAPLAPPILFAPAYAGEQYWPEHASRIHRTARCPTTRDAFVDLSESQFKAANFTIHSRQNRLVSGRPAVLLEYEGSFGGPTLRFLALAVVLPERVLLVTCTSLASSYSTYESEFKRSMNSLRLSAVH